MTCRRLRGGSHALRGGGRELDEDGSGTSRTSCVTGGADGALVCGTAGEGMLLSLPSASRRWRPTLPPPARLAIMAHCGAQIDGGHRRARGARGRGRRRRCIGDRASLLPARRAGAARAPDGGGARLRPAAVLHLCLHGPQRLPRVAAGDRATCASACRTSAGLKVSEAPWERFEPYLIDGLDIFVGPEALIDRGLAGGAVGAISALASALPELVAAAVRERTPEATARAAAARAALERFPMPSALKTVCAAARGATRQRGARTAACARRRRAVRAGGRPARTARGSSGVSAPGRQGDGCRRAARQRRAAARASWPPRAAGAWTALARKHGMRLGAQRFVAGETFAECAEVLARLNASGLLREHDAARRGRPLRRGGARGRGRSTRRILDGIAAARPARQRRAQAHAPRTPARRGARLRERQAARRPRAPPSATSSASTWSTRASSTRRSASTGACAPTAATAVGTVLQAYLFRTPGDLERAAAAATQPAPRQGRVPRAGRDRLSAQGRRRRRLRAADRVRSRRRRATPRSRRTTSR